MADANIVADYDWTSVPRGTPLRGEAPYIMVTAHELKSNQLQQFILGYMNTLQPTSMTKGQDAGLAFYKGLYQGGEKVGTFKFPFFTDDYRSFSNEYDDSFSTISQRGAQMIGAEVLENLAGAGEKIVGGGIALGKGILSVGAGLAAGVKSLAGPAGSGAGAGEGSMRGFASGVEKMKGAMGGTKSVGAPGTYIETPKFYQYANTDQGLQVSFALSNTLNDDGAKMNADFIKNFTIINRPKREGSVGMTFPAIYNVQVPGLRYIEWASLDNLSFSMLGQRRLIDGVIIPEAYIVNMTFTSLTIEASNFMTMVQTPSQTSAQYEQTKAEALGILQSQQAERVVLQTRETLRQVRQAMSWGSAID